MFASSFGVVIIRHCLLSLSAPVWREAMFHWQLMSSSKLRESAGLEISGQERSKKNSVRQVKNRVWKSNQKCNGSCEITGTGERTS